MKRVYLRVSGVVQGVGFRYYVYYTAQRLGLTGWVRNCCDDAIEMEAQGEDGAVAQFRAAVARGPRYAQVEQVDCTPLACIEERSFEIADW